MDMFLKSWIRNLDWVLISTLMILAVYSCAALYASTYGKTGTDVPSNILSKQILFEILGFITMMITAKIDYGNLRKGSRWIYGISIFFLVLVFAMPRRFGAHSWIPLGLLAFQPSELAKLALIIVIANYMSHIFEAKIPFHSLKNACWIWGMFIVPFVLTLKEPALGQALVMFAIILFMYMVFAKGSRFSILLGALAFIVFGITIIALYFPNQSTLFIQNVLIKHHILQSFQANRIIVWLNPNFDPSGAGYNVREAQIAVGSGQIYGEGFLYGAETRGNWIPNQWTDFIFTAIGEQFGFVGSSMLIFVFFILLYRLIRMASLSPDSFGVYLIIGIIGMFGFQVFQNVGMNMYLSPATGITLPFISYGGSSLIANYMAVGIALNVYRKRKSLRFSKSFSAIGVNP